ncbi:MAG: hypothetical protein OEN56_14345 [Gemmatimonadota bacterium]|nr:hypothetical protein [Gemmatimonadota bacterium]
MSSSLAGAVAVSTIVIALAIVSVAIMSGILFVRVNRILVEMRRSARQSFGPVSDRARSISDNVEFITQALRTDVDKLNSSIRALSDRLQLASDRMEERIEEFNALMEVVQGEAEDLFLDTASTARGIREGARAIAGSSDRRQAGRLRRDAGVEGDRARDEVDEAIQTADGVAATPRDDGPGIVQRSEPHASGGSEESTEPDDEASSVSGRKD